MWVGSSRSTSCKVSCWNFLQQNNSVNGSAPPHRVELSPSVPNSTRKSIQVLWKIKARFFICCFSSRLIKTSRELSPSPLTHTAPNWPNFHLPCAGFSRSFRLFSFDFHRFSVSFQRSSINVCLVSVVPLWAVFSVLIFSQLQMRRKKFTVRN